jgi:transposase
MDTNLIPALNESLQIDLPQTISFELLKEKLSQHINYLIQSDFQKLISVLYRVDVSEKKLKSLLKEHPDSDAGKIITELIIERQLQKIKSRQQFNQGDKNINEEDVW